MHTHTLANTETHSHAHTYAHTPMNLHTCSHFSFTRKRLRLQSGVNSGQITTVQQTTRSYERQLHFDNIVFSEKLKTT